MAANENIGFQNLDGHDIGYFQSYVQTTGQQFRGFVPTTGQQFPSLAQPTGQASQPFINPNLNHGHSDSVSNQSYGNIQHQSGRYFYGGHPSSEQGNWPSSGPNEQMRNFGPSPAPLPQSYYTSTGTINSRNNVDYSHARQTSHSMSTGTIYSNPNVDNSNSRQTNSNIPTGAILSSPNVTRSNYSQKNHNTNTGPIQSGPTVTQSDPGETAKYSCPMPRFSTNTHSIDVSRGGGLKAYNSYTTQKINKTAREPLLNQALKIVKVYMQSLFSTLSKLYPSLSYHEILHILYASYFLPEEKYFQPKFVHPASSLFDPFQFPNHIDYISFKVALLSLAAQAEKKYPDLARCVIKGINESERTNANKNGNLHSQTPHSSVSAQTHPSGVPDPKQTVPRGVVPQTSSMKDSVPKSQVQDSSTRSEAEVGGITASRLYAQNQSTEDQQGQVQSAPPPPRSREFLEREIEHASKQLQYLATYKSKVTNPEQIQAIIEAEKKIYIYLHLITQPPSDNKVSSAHVNAGGSGVHNATNGVENLAPIDNALRESISATSNNESDNEILASESSESSAVPTAPAIQVPPNHQVSATFTTNTSSIGPQTSSLNMQSQNTRTLPQDQTNKQPTSSLLLNTPSQTLPNTHQNAFTPSGNTISNSASNITEQQAAILKVPQNLNADRISGHSVNKLQQLSLHSNRPMNLPSNDTQTNIPSHQTPNPLVSAQTDLTSVNLPSQLLEKPPKELLEKSTAIGLTHGNESDLSLSSPKSDRSESCSLPGSPNTFATSIARNSLLDQSPYLDKLIFSEGPSIMSNIFGTSGMVDLESEDYDISRANLHLMKKYRPVSPDSIQSPPSRSLSSYAIDSPPIDLQEGD